MDDPRALAVSSTIRRTVLGGGEPLHPETHTWAQQLPCQCASKHCQEKEPNASYTIAGKETEVFVSLAEGEFGLCKGA